MKKDEFYAKFQDLLDEFEDAACNNSEHQVQEKRAKLEEFVKRFIEEKEQELRREKHDR